MRVRMRGKTRLLFGALAMFLAAIILFFPGSAVTSAGGNLTVMPANVSLNWTGVSINITSNVTNGVFLIVNTSTTIQPQYFGIDLYQVDGADSVYANFSSDKRSACFVQTLSGMKFLVQNASSGIYTNITDALNQNSSTIYNLTAYQFCPPGYYFGLFNVTQNGTLDYANISMSAIIPVSSQNTFNESDSKGGFKGALASSASAYHSYYFNTSQAENITGVTINLTWTDYNQDLDMFLFNSSGSLLGKSIERPGSDTINYIALPSSSNMWEVRIFGNISSNANYTGWLYFTTLNATNTSNTNQSIASLQFGSLDPNATSSSINYTLVNVDNKVWTNIMENKEIYRVNSWTSNQSTNYEFLVPSFAQKIKVKIEWTGSAARWNISLNDSSGSLIGNSSDKYYNANISNATREEFVIYNGPFNSTNDGIWNITVSNSTAISGNYSLTAYVWIPNSSLISNYPSSFTFNSTGNGNYSKNVSIYLSIPETNITNGSYEGFVEYYKSGEWKFRIPVYFSVKTGTLLINNTLESLTVTLNDNVGFNRLGTNGLNIPLTVKNIGYYNISYTNQTSDNKLNNTEAGKTSQYMMFNVSWPNNPLIAGQNDTLNITIFINTSLANETGVYTGNITLNTTNASVNSSSYPFKIFTIVLNVNLTQYLTVNITSFSPSTVDVPQNVTNITTNISVKLANGSVISSNNIMYVPDFNQTYIVEGNYTADQVVYMQNQTVGDIGGVCPSGFSICSIKSSLPTVTMGGLYYIYAYVRFNTSVLGGTGVNLTGTGRADAQIPVNQNAIQLQGLYAIDNIFETSSTVYIVEVRNYGPLAATDLQVRFNKGTCTALTISRNIGANTTCSPVANGNVSATDWKTTLSGYASYCRLAWTLTAGSVDSDTDCDYMSVNITSNHPSYDNGKITPISLTIFNNAAAPQQQGQQQTTTCSSNSTCASTQYCAGGSCVTLACPSGMTAVNHVCTRNEGKLEITDYTQKVYVLQGGSNSTRVTVKNSGGYNYTAKLVVTSVVDGLNSSVTPASYSLGTGNSGIFTLNFSASGTINVGYYTLTAKTYADENSSVYAMKNITIGVQPAEQTKGEINKTYGDLKNLFASISSLFNQLPASTEANYTLANRTYQRLLNMFTDIENKISAGNYLDAKTLLDEANASLASFKQDVDQLRSGPILPILTDTMTLVAILVVILVVGGFLAYLLLPAKRGTGFHPALGYTPHEKSPKVSLIKRLFSRKPNLSGQQKTLGEYKKEESQKLLQAAKPAQPAQKPAEGKVYDGSYQKLDKFPLEYDQKKFKEKKD